MLSEKKINDFQNLILNWYTANQRDLPWRKTHDGYAVLLSEVMLQQTQVDRVKKYWTDWLARWPTFSDLATAPTSEVIRAWAGLGYNRRVVYLQKTAREVTQNHHGILPKTIKEMQALPGIGPGTAGALMNFVWNVDTPYVEVNMRRIFQRLAVGPETAVGWAKESALGEVARAVLPHGQARIWPHALMDFGALACKSNDPFCDTCPLGTIIEKRNRAFRNQTYKQKPRAKEPFEETNRYWRGRILATLRMCDAPLTDQDLYQALPDFSRLDQKRFDTLLTQLIREDLISKINDRYALPE